MADDVRSGDARMEQLDARGWRRSGLVKALIAVCLIATPAAARTHTSPHARHHQQSWSQHGGDLLVRTPYDPAVVEQDGVTLRNSQQVAASILADADARLRAAQANAVSAGQQLDRLIDASRAEAKRHPWHTRARDRDVSVDANARHPDEGVWPDDCTEIENHEYRSDCQ